MTEPDSGRFHTVTDPIQARLLTEPESKEFFKPFLARERSTAEAAGVMSCSLNIMLYRIKTLLRAGLIEVVRERPRKGRPAKVYRSVHDAYFVPFSVTPYATLEERLMVQAEPIFAGLIESYAAALKQNERYGHHIFVGENGAVWTSDLLPELTPAGLPTLYTDVYVRLLEDDARALGQLLKEALLRAMRADIEAKSSGEPKQDFLFMVALLPFTKGH